MLYDVVVGDVMMAEGYVRVIRFVQEDRRPTEATRNCHWMDQVNEDYQRVFVDADAPEEVILKGGGTAFVLPLVEATLRGCAVFRFGTLVFKVDNEGVVHIPVRPV